MEDDRGSIKEIEPLRTLRDAAERINVPLWLLQRLARKGEIPSYRLNGRVRIRLSELQAYIEKCREGGPQ